MKKTKSPVFTITTGRTGTTTLISILNTLKQVNAYHEPKPHYGFENVDAYFYKLYKSVFFKEEITKSLNRFTIRDFRMFYANLFNKCYVEHGMNAFLVDFLIQRYPKAKFIFMHRHPQQIIKSGLERDWYKSNDFDKYRIQPVIEGLNMQSQSEKIAYFWDRTNKAGIEAREKYGPSKVHILPFDKLHNNLELEMLFLFLGIDTLNINFDKIHEILSKRLNKNKNNVEYELSENDKAIVFETATKLGYKI